MVQTTQPQCPVIRRQEVIHLTTASISPQITSPTSYIDRPTTTNLTSTPRMHEFDDPLPSPASTVASLTRELEDTLQTLDLQAAMKGQFVVKPQVFCYFLSALVAVELNLEFLAIAI
jgi:hypothetical protein